MKDIPDTLARAIRKIEICSLNLIIFPALQFNIYTWYDASYILISYKKEVHTYEGKHMIRH